MPIRNRIVVGGSCGCARPDSLASRSPVTAEPSHGCTRRSGEGSRRASVRGGPVPRQNRPRRLRRSRENPSRSGVPGARSRRVVYGFPSGSSRPPARRAAELRGPGIVRPVSRCGSPGEASRGGARPRARRGRGEPARLGFTGSARGAPLPERDRAQDLDRPLEERRGPGVPDRRLSSRCAAPRAASSGDPRPRARGTAARGRRRNRRRRRPDRSRSSPGTGSPPGRAPPSRSRDCARAS